MRCGERLSPKRWLFQDWRPVSPVLLTYFSGTWARRNFARNGHFTSCGLTTGSERSFHGGGTDEKHNEHKNKYSWRGRHRRPGVLPAEGVQGERLVVRGRADLGVVRRDLFAAAEAMAGRRAARAPAVRIRPRPAFGR